MSTVDPAKLDFVALERAIHGIERKITKFKRRTKSQYGSNRKLWPEPVLANYNRMKQAAKALRAQTKS